jgi:hypothetical protein
MINKGITFPDGTYWYTCRKCQGTGSVRGNLCDHCYDLDVNALTGAIKLARGERYYALLKAILSVCGKVIVDDAKALAEPQEKKFYALDVAYLAIKYNLSFKVVFEWLEETHFCRAGMHKHMREAMRRNKKTVAALMNEACEKYGLPVEDVG